MVDNVRNSIRRSIWWGWGDPDHIRPLKASEWKILEKLTGARPAAHPLEAPEVAAVILPQPTLKAAELAELTRIVGPENCSQEQLDRLEHCGGKSFPDLYRRRQGEASLAPDAVVFPPDADAVEEVLAYCVQADIAVVPFSGGTSVVGGVEPLRGGKHALISLDLRHLNRLVHFDPISRQATLQAGMRGPEIETALREHGMTLGHFPQSHQEACVGGYVATRSAGQSSSGYGRSDEMVRAVKVATGRGVITLGDRSPASAAGPRLLDLLVGSEGTLGVITEATFDVVPYPAHKRYAAWSFPDFPRACAAMRALAQELGHGIMPTVARLSDEPETFTSLTMAGSAGEKLQRYLGMRGQKQPCLAIFLWEGDSKLDLRYRQHRAQQIFRRHRGVRLPALLARKWEQGRFHGPYMRDELMRHGMTVDTLETATTWANLPVTYRAVETAIKQAFAKQDTPALAYCHISHIYPGGASLYYTFAARGAADPLAQWQAVKDAACKAINTAGATITHHHAVGADHRPYLDAEITPLGGEILRAVKNVIDPTGILNPEKLIPAPPTLKKG